MGRRSLVMKNNTGGGRGCFGRRPTWDRKQRWMRDECEQDPTVNSMPRGLKYSAGHNHDDDLGGVALVGVVGVSNASSLGRLSLVKSSFDHDLLATWISPQQPWRYHDSISTGPGTCRQRSRHAGRSVTPGCRARAAAASTGPLPPSTTPTLQKISIAWA